MTVRDTIATDLVISPFGTDVPSMVDVAPSAEANGFGTTPGRGDRAGGYIHSRGRPCGAREWSNPVSGGNDAAPGMSD